MSVKKCLIPICKNTSLLNPGKLFIIVPINLETRKLWFDVIFDTGIQIPKTKNIFVCEDHFNLQHDAENFEHFKTIGNILRMKKGVAPHKNLSEIKVIEHSQLTSSAKKRKLQNIEAYKCKKLLDFQEADPSTPLKPTSRDQFNSPASAASSSSFVPQSTSSCDEITTDLMKEYMKQNIKITTYNIENNSRLFLGLPQEEYFLIKLTENKCKIRYEDIMITLKKIRCDDSYARLGISFSKSASMIGKIFLASVPIIAAQYQNLIFFPNDIDTMLNMPAQFLPRYKHVRAIIDCLEIKIETPSNARLQAITWSQYKKTNTIKYLISSTPHGLINFISCGFGGRTSDTEIIEKSKFLEMLPNNCTVLADRGFKNIESLLHMKNCTLLRPPSVSADTKMLKTEVLESRRIAACRIHIERVIRRVREFKMLEPHSTVNFNLVSWLDYIMIIVCALINTQGSLIKLSLKF